MKRRTNFINNAITLAITLGLVLGAAFITSNKYYVSNVFTVIPFYLIGAVVSGFINAVVHEFGHLIAGKKNDFALISFTVWFFRWTKRGKRTKFSFVMFGDSAGSTEMLPVGSENLAKRFKGLTMGGIIASAIMTLLSIPAFCLTGYLDVRVFCVLAMFLPISAYYFFGTLLPTSSEGTLSDGGVLYGLNKNTNVSKVTLNLLAIHGNLYEGKTPSQIDESLFFDLPQLPEDDINFALLYNARYNYYLDKEDYENAKKTSDRLMGIMDSLPASVRPVIKMDALYNACTFDYNEEVADDLMYELEKYLNKNNDATSIRVKMAYLAFVRHETDNVDIFYKKGKKEAKKHLVKGLGLYEAKLIDETYAKIPAPLTDENLSSLSNDSDGSAE